VRVACSIPFLASVLESNVTQKRFGDTSLRMLPFFLPKPCADDALLSLASKPEASHYHFSTSPSRVHTLGHNKSLPFKRIQEKSSSLVVVVQ